MKFIMAYSGGKDCTLALDRMIARGHEPVCLFTTVTQKEFSFKHGIRRELFARYEQCLGIPVVTCVNTMVHDEETIYAALPKVIEETSAEALCTGDIYRSDVYEWNRHMTERLGIGLETPLWGETPEKVVDELIDNGYRCMIKVVRTDRLQESLLGKILDRDVLASIRGKADLCGEDGEYHTVALDGPIFRKPLKVRPGRILSVENIAMLDLFPDDD